MSGTSIKKSVFVPKRSERLSNVIQKLKFQVVAYSDSSDDDMDEEITILGQNGLNAAYSSIFSRDSALTKSYLMWQNNANVCWLDASMALLVHNRTLIESINERSRTQIANIIQQYYKATSILNGCSDSKHTDENVKTAKDLLRTVQESALKYLQPIVKYKEGEPDSAFCSLFNLIAEDKAVKELFDLEYTWVQVCNKCKTHRAKKHRKPIITLPRVENFQPSSPISLYQCLACKASDQKMTLDFRTLPQCLLFHFERGAGKGELQCSSFEVDGRTYQMTGVMKLEKGKDFDLNHFVTFIRNPPTDMWLECNDLNDGIAKYSVLPPYIALQDVYIMMFEAFDEKGSVFNQSLAADKCGLGEESVGGSADIPLIDLADEVEKEGIERKSRGSSDKTFNYNDGKVNKCPLDMNLQRIELLPSNCESREKSVGESADIPLIDLADETKKDATESRSRGTNDKTCNFSTFKPLPSICESDFLVEARNKESCDKLLQCSDGDLNYYVLNKNINSMPLPSNCETSIESLHVPGCFCDNIAMGKELVNMVTSSIPWGMISFGRGKGFSC